MKLLPFALLLLCSCDGRIQHSSAPASAKSEDAWPECAIRTVENVRCVICRGSFVDTPAVSCDWSREK